MHRQRELIADMGVRIDEPGATIMPRASITRPAHKGRRPAANASPEIATSPTSGIDPV